MQDGHTALSVSVRRTRQPDAVLLRLVVENRSGHVLVRAAGELDLSSAPNLTSAAEDAFADGYRVLLLDLSGVSFMDSTGISAVLSVDREAQERDAYAAIIAPSENALRVLEMLGVDQVLNIYDTVDAALAELG
jgi:anti-sigma B factor antagonist